MASPQLENGFTRIANEILEALSKTPLSGSEFRLAIAILRHTYGMQKKTAEISTQILRKTTNLISSRLSEAKKSLQKRGILFVTKKRNRSISTYEFNKNYDGWNSLRKNVTLRKNVKVITEKRNSVGVLPIVVKERKKKESKKKIKFILPDWIDPKQWKQFLAHRKTLRKPATEYAQHLLIKKLEKITKAGFDPKDIINTSIERGWQGFFQPDESENSWRRT